MRRKSFSILAISIIMSLILLPFAGAYNVAYGIDALSTATAAVDTKIGTEDDNTLIGDKNANEIYGEEGNDTIKGKKGDDALYGGDGDDLIRGGQGDDFILGDKMSEEADWDCEENGPPTGNDTIYGGAGEDFIKAGHGDDEVYGGAKSDTIYGGHGVDTIDGGSGNDDIHGGPDDDNLYGSNGADTIQGCTGDDLIDGGDGDDILKGCQGDDTISGGNGDDELYGGPGSDTLDGGDGYDRVQQSGSIDKYDIVISGDDENTILTLTEIKSDSHGHEDSEESPDESHSKADGGKHEDEPVDETISSSHSHEDGEDSSHDCGKEDTVTVDTIINVEHVDFHKSSEEDDLIDVKFIPLTPDINSYHRNVGGSYTVNWGYTNSNKFTAYEDDHRFEAGSSVILDPEDKLFEVGNHSNAFQTSSGHVVQKWKLGDKVIVFDATELELDYQKYLSTSRAQGRAKSRLEMLQLWKEIEAFFEKVFIKHEKVDHSAKDYTIRLAKRGYLPKHEDIVKNIDSNMTVGEAIDLLNVVLDWDITEKLDIAYDRNDDLTKEIMNVLFTTAFELEAEEIIEYNLESTEENKVEEITKGTFYIVLTKCL